MAIETELLKPPEGSSQGIRDYSLIGEESKSALEEGLAEATWYISPVPHEEMKKLLVRRNGPALRDTLLWFGLITGSGYLFYYLWGSWWAVLPYIVYSVLYASTSDSRWHESGHGTAFRTDWMNNVLYEISSFMVFRQSVPWRWSHTRHHSDTIIRGRDPEIAVPRPPNLFQRFLAHFALKSTLAEFKKILLHAMGRVHPEVATYLPSTEYRKVYLRARIYLLIFASVIGLSIYLRSLLPLFYIGFPTFLGSWLMVIYGTTQHAGLAENVLDHRLNSRTVYMSRIHRYLYWNMNYHIEHHMFPLVPYHALPRLHKLVKHDMPKPYTSILDAYREIIPALIKQSKDESYFVKRELPATARKEMMPPKANIHTGNPDRLLDGWIEICPAGELLAGDVLQFDLGESTYAVYRTNEDNYYATDGICTHGNMHLAKGLVIGDQIECAKHNGRFSLLDGSVKRAPVCVALKTYDVKKENGKLYLKPGIPGGRGAEEEGPTLSFRVESNRNVATFIRELVLLPEDPEQFSFRPGEYIQLEIPAYETSLKYIEVDEPYRKTWKDMGVFRYFAHNPGLTKRNFSMASDPEQGGAVRFNIRLSLPPEGLNCSTGVGSSYAFGLKAGDQIRAFGPYGDFHIKETGREMVYIGGGAGMAPLRSHISHLFETLKTPRKVSFWYGARSGQELFYTDYFEKMDREHANFTFRAALSEPEPSDNWDSFTGFIHQIVEKEFLAGHENPADAEYYLCGPPAMVSACKVMLEKYQVPGENISFDEF